MSNARSINVSTSVANPTISELGTEFTYDAEGVASAGGSRTGSPGSIRRVASTSNDTASPDDYGAPLLDRKLLAPVIDQVKETLLTQKFLTPDVVESESEYFFGALGLDAWFFNEQTPDDLAKYIVSLASAKMIAKLTGAKLQLALNDVKSGRVMFGVPAEPGSRSTQAMALEYKIEKEYLGEGYRRTGKDDRLYRMQCYRSTGPVSIESDTHLRLYVLEAPSYVDNAVTDSNFVVANVDDLELVADQSFYSTSTTRTRVLVSEMLATAAAPAQLGPVIRGFHYPLSDEFRLLICYRQGTTHSFLSGLADLYHSYGATATRKYVEHFSHGYVLYSAYLDLKGQTSDDVSRQHLFEALKDDASFLYCLPRTSLSPLIKEKGLSYQEHAYSYAGWKFAFHFISRYSDDYGNLLQSIDEGGNTSTRAMAMESLGKLKGKLDQDSLPESRLRDAILEHTDLIRELYKDFERLHARDEQKRERDSDESFLETPERKKLLAKIKRAVHTELEEQIFRQFIIFNHSVLRTNFYKRDKVALSFRLDPLFLNRHEYPITPYGVIFILGSEFRGFHVRFQDVARGGIRIVRSHGPVAFLRNLPTLFDEAYNLAATQHRKNKDIPEGGSKGAILLSMDHQDKGTSAFEKYIDAMLDLLLPDPEYIVDYYGKEEILFLGPDEGTADVMNWASAHARTRGASFWKAFTTGKSRSTGGIPHDLYGMTTNSIHQYVLGCLEKRGIDEANVRKLQTGGPDGDLGSNEILISNDKTIAIVDGGGVLYDPLGLDRSELLRLARSRSLARLFDQSKLSKDGWYVDVDHQDLSVRHATSTWPLPDSLLPYTSGVHLRNVFHLTPMAGAELFVPCGGRPRSVDASTVTELLSSSAPRFDIIVEGANLFFTQEARLRLEAQGVLLIKDASANKGGVTSSSLEVLAALALNDDEFERHMCVADDDNVPEFYATYVQGVLGVIKLNAQLEFECLWREHTRTKVALSVLSDQLSLKIVSLSASIAQSALWSREKVRTSVLEKAVPPVLLQLVSLDTLLERVPTSYLQALFSSYLASRFVYEHGLDSGEFGFFEYIQQYV